MKYQFRSETETVYIEADYRLVITSSTGVSLKDGQCTLTAEVRRISNGSLVSFPSTCFTWKRHEDSESFQEVNSNVLNVTSSMLFNGSATFRCYFEKDGLYWKDNTGFTLSDTVKGEDGWSTVQVPLYKRTAIAPETYDGEAVTYTFSTAAMVGNTGTWLTYVPSGQDPLYVIYASAFSQGESDTIQPNEWSTPAILSENGTDGEKGDTVATITIYQRSITKPSLPSDNATYSIITHQITGIGNWKSFIPDGAYPCWAATATITTKTNSAVVTPASWSEPVKIFQNGADGEKGDPGNDGANAPYQRTIYIASENKPEKPSGNASSIPTGWSLQMPAREGSEVIYVSTAYVVFTDNVAVYSEWSDPVQYSGKDGTISIVEWQWGSSDKYPPDVADYIFVYDDLAIIFNSDAFIGNISEWTRYTIPDQPDGIDYLWKREFDYETGQWNVYLAQGPTGLPGDYMSLGYVIVGTNSIIYAGLDKNGEPSKDKIRITLGGVPIQFNSVYFTLTGTHTRYFLVAPIIDTKISPLDVVYITTEYIDGKNVLQWKSFGTGEVYSDGYVLSEITMQGDSIEYVSVITPRRFGSYIGTYFMGLLNDGDKDDIDAVAEAMGIERVFEKVAAYQAFIKELFANDIELTFIQGEDNSVIGKFHSTGYSKGDYAKPGKPQGFFMDASGYAEFVKCIFRDVDIVSYDNAGDVIFRLQKSYNSISYNHSESATRKNFIDLIGDDKSGEVQVNGTTLPFEYVGKDLGFSLQTFPIYEDVVSGKVVETVAPYDCTVEFDIAEGVLVGGYDVYINDEKKGTVYVLSSSITCDVKTGDRIKLSVGTGIHTGKMVMYVTDYPYIPGSNPNAGSNIISGVKLFIYDKIGGARWPYGKFTSLDVPANTTTNIVYNGISFDSLAYRLDEGDISTFVSTAKAYLEDGVNYTASSSSYVIYMNKRYYPETFRLSGNSIILTFDDYSTLTITDTNYAISGYLAANTKLPSVEVSGLNPINDDSEIGTSKPFYRIASRIISCENIDCPSVIQSVKQGSGTISGCDCYYSITSDKHIDLSFIIPINSDATAPITIGQETSLAINGIYFSILRNDFASMQITPIDNSDIFSRIGGTYTKGSIEFALLGSSQDINGESIKVYKSMIINYLTVNESDCFTSISISISGYLSTYSYNALIGGL